MNKTFILPFIAILTLTILITSTNAIIGGGGIISRLFGQFLGGGNSYGGGFGGGRGGGFGGRRQFFNQYDDY